MHTGLSNYSMYTYYIANRTLTCCARPGPCGAWASMSLQGRGRPAHVSVVLAIQSGF